VSLVSKIKNIFSPKSALVYYGQDLEYSEVSKHNYVLVQADYIDTNKPNFIKYKNKMYAYVSICEISPQIKEYEKVQDTWIVAKNSEWNSLVLDIKNKEYQKFIFNEIIDKRIALGFENFFFDTLDSYQLASSSNAQRESYKRALIEFINIFHKKYPKAKLIINRGFELIDSIYNSIDAVLFESYYFGLGSGETPYRRVSEEDRKWLDIHIKKIKTYSLPIIALDYLDENDMDLADEAIKSIQKNGMIAYVSNRDLNIYGRSS